MVDEKLGNIFQCKFENIFKWEMASVFVWYGLNLKHPHTATSIVESILECKFDDWIKGRNVCLLHSKLVFDGTAYVFGKFKFQMYGTHILYLHIRTYTWRSICILHICERSFCVWLYLWEEFFCLVIF